ncbi:MAG: secretion protein HlyD [Verrucomicrobiaceae bacterium]|nr:secretion protein HlyD [Verrucomicrobiaceae bacterium]
MTIDNSPEFALQAAQVIKRERRKWQMGVFLGVVLLIAIGAGGYLLFIGQYSESTDDAYVAGNIMQISAQIPGTVTEVLVDDTQQVHAGQTLVRLDSKETRAALAQAEALLSQTIKQARNLSDVSRAYSELIAAREAELNFAESSLRARSNAKVEVVSREELSQARQHNAVAQANLAAAHAQADAAKALASKADPTTNPMVIQAAEQVRLAYTNYARAQIISPIDGTVGQRSVQIGQQVAPGLPLMSVIAMQQLWAEANLKEEQIRHVRIGQPVTVSTEVYGSAVKYRGHIQGLSAGTGSAFSMLPAQNATGNWIKVVQRIPVVIALDATDLKAHPLRLGLSLHITIDTHERSGSMINLANTQSLLPLRSQQQIDTDASARVTAIINAALSDE